MRNVRLRCLAGSFPCADCIIGEFDFAYRGDVSAAAYTPRIVGGVGHRMEVGVNLNGITSPGPSQTTPTFAWKWKPYDGAQNGWAFIVGDDLFIRSTVSIT
jgi:hypothetical protein